MDDNNQSLIHRLINDIIKTGFFEMLLRLGKLIMFLNDIWPLATMPSTDKRYKTLEGDITQHCVNNPDYDWTYLFGEILDLYKSPDSFEKFINTLLNHDYYETPDSQQKITKILNDFLLHKGTELVCINEKDGFKLFEIQKIGSTIGHDIPENSIPFFVAKVKMLKKDIDKFEYLHKHEYPFFVLASDIWDDFNTVSQYHLYFYSDEFIRRKYIGKLKIIDNSPGKQANGSYYTDDYISDGPFTLLPENFCSLGQEESYYSRLKDLFKESYLSVLRSIRDCALFPQFYDNVAAAPARYSLTRDNTAERLMREIRFKLEGRMIENRYHFDYIFKPNYSDDSITIPFKFDDNEKLYTHRLMVVIGKNGVGKTTMLSTLPKAICEADTKIIKPFEPLFSKVIAISSSVYDTFEIPQDKKGRQYVYCGMTKRENNEVKILSKQDCLEQLESNLKQINYLGRTESYLELLSTIINLDPESYIKDSGNKKSINVDKLLDFYSGASSGESVFIYTFGGVLANIRYDSLLVFDEPETHLHPNAICGLMNALYVLLEKFKSYAIIATHSALVVREVSADCVLVMSRNGNTPSIAKIGRESLGGNIAVLIDEIFRDRDSNKYYKEKLKGMVDLHEWTYDETIKHIQSNGLPIGLNLSLYLETICRRYSNEENKML